MGGCGFFVRSFLLYPDHPGLFRSAGSVHLTSNASSCTTITQADIVSIDAAPDDRWSAGQLFSMHQRGHLPSTAAIEPNKPAVTLKLVRTHVFLFSSPFTLLTLKQGSYPSSQEDISSVSWLVLHNLQQDKPDVPTSVIAVGVEFNGKSTMSAGAAINYDNVDASTSSSNNTLPFTCGWHPAPHIRSSIDRLNFTPPIPLNVFLHPAWFAIVFEQPAAAQTSLPPGDALPLLDEAAARTQRFSEHLLYPSLPSTVDKWPLLQFNSWGYGAAISEDKMAAALQSAKQLGIEAFVLDFGWQDTLEDGTPCLGHATAAALLLTTHA